MKFKEFKKANEVKDPEPSIIMIVDDEPHILKELETLLAEDYKIITALNAQEALDKIQAMEKPDEQISLIICDHRMPPGMTGVDLLKKLAGNQIMSDTVRIILTAHDEKEIILSAVNEANIYKFIIKPFDPDALKLTIQRAVEFFYHQQDLKECKADLIAKNAEIAELKMKIQDLTGLLGKWEGTPD